VIQLSYEFEIPQQPITKKETMFQIYTILKKKPTYAELFMFVVKMAPCTSTELTEEFSKKRFGVDKKTIVRRLAFLKNLQLIYCKKRSDIFNDPEVEEDPLDIKIIKKWKEQTIGLPKQFRKNLLSTNYFYTVGLGEEEEVQKHICERILKWK